MGASVSSDALTGGVPIESSFCRKKASKMRRKATPESLQRDVARLNALCRWLAHPQTGTKLFFEVATRFDNPSLARSFWRLPRATVIVAWQQGETRADGGNAHLSTRRYFLVPTRRRPEHLSSPRALSVHDFYRVLYFVQNNASAFTQPSEEPSHDTVDQETHDDDDDFSDDDGDCPICLERDATVVLSCTHTFCSECMEEWRQKQSEAAECPMCRASCADEASDWNLLDEDSNELLDSVLNSPFAFVAAQPRLDDSNLQLLAVATGAAREPPVDNN
ncbi:MAG: hypothetical protein MHM6MM_001310 [Cercozoa sp. M6MM]